MFFDAFHGEFEVVLAVQGDRIGKSDREKTGPLAFILSMGASIIFRTSPELRVKPNTCSFSGFDLLWRIGETTLATRSDEKLC